MPREFGSPGFIRTRVAEWAVSGGAAALAPDFAANTALTIFGGTAGYAAGFVHWVEALEFTVGAADFAGAGGTLTFDLRRNSTTGPILATLTIALASALRGVTLRALVTNPQSARMNDTDVLFLLRKATGTVFTAGEGTWRICSRQRPQSAK